MIQSVTNYGIRKRLNYQALKTRVLLYLGKKWIMDSILASETTNSFKVKLSKIFMRKGNTKGVKYVYPVEWMSPTKKNYGLSSNH